jgi:hypothetical protein
MILQAKTLRKRKAKAKKQLTRIGPFIEGTLAVTRRMCGGTGCACRRGKKHAAMYLTWKDDQETRSLYIPVGRQKEAQAMSRNYKKLKKLIRKLSDIHKKLLVHKNPA